MHVCMTNLCMLESLNQFHLATRVCYAISIVGHPMNLLCWLFVNNRVLLSSGIMRKVKFKAPILASGFMRWAYCRTLFPKIKTKIFLYGSAVNVKPWCAVLCCAVAGKRSSFDITKLNPSFGPGIPRPHDGHSLKGVVVLYGASVTKPSVEESGRFRLSSSFHGSKVSPHRSLIMVQGPDSIVSWNDDFNFRIFCLKLKIVMTRWRGFRHRKEYTLCRYLSISRQPCSFTLIIRFLLGSPVRAHIIDLFQFIDFHRSG